MKRHTILVEIKIDSSNDSDKINENIEFLLEHSAIKSILSSVGLNVISMKSLIARPAK